MLLKLAISSNVLGIIKDDSIIDAIKNEKRGRYITSDEIEILLDGDDYSNINVIEGDEKAIYNIINACYKARNDDATLCIMNHEGKQLKFK